MIPFNGQHYPHKSRAVASSRLINCYTETIGDQNAKSKFIVIGTEGTNTWLDMGDYGDIRGSHVSANGVLYRVYGDSLIRVNSDKTFDVLQSIGEGARRVSMADNGYYLMLADGTNLWAYNFNTEVLQDATPIDFSNPTYVKYIDQRFVAINSDPTKDYALDDVPNNNKIFFSETGPEGCLTWLNASNFYSETSADANIAMEICNNSLWVWGQRSYEVYQTQGNPDIPFYRIGGASGEIGCLAPNSVTTIGGSVFWLGSSGSGNNQIFMSNGTMPVVISNPAISYQLDQMGDTSDAVGFSYQKESHVFYVITFIGGNKTFVYDVKEQNWSRRTTREKLTNVENRWAVNYIDAVYSTLLCGVSSTENVGSLVLELDSNKYDDWDGRPIVRTLQGPYIWNNLKKLFIRMFKVDMEVGTVPQNGQGANPILEVGISDDGYVFDYIRRVNLPVIGKYKGQVILTGLGSSYNPVIRLKISDPIPFVVLGADMEVRQSNAY